MPASTPRSNQSGFAHLFIILLLVALIAAGVYLVLQRTSFRSRAAVEVPETSLTLVGRGDDNYSIIKPNIGTSNPVGSQDQTYNVSPGGVFYMDVLVRSNVEAVNLISTRIQFPATLVQVESMRLRPITRGPGLLVPDRSTPRPASQPVEGDQLFFINSWLEESSNNQTGQIRLTGGISSPGFLNTVGTYGLMARIQFRALPNTTGQTAKIEFLENGTEIYKSSDNLQITPVIKRGLRVNIGTSATSDPTASSTPSSSNNVTVNLVPPATSPVQSARAAINFKVNSYSVMNGGSVTITGQITGLVSGKQYEVSICNTSNQCQGPAARIPADSAGRIDLGSQSWTSTILSKPIKSIVVTEFTSPITNSSCFVNAPCLIGNLSIDSNGVPSTAPLSTPLPTPTPTSPPTVISPDLNKNNRADLGDASVFLSRFTSEGSTYDVLIDLDGNKVLNARDFSLLVKYLQDNNIISR